MFELTPLATLLFAALALAAGGRLARRAGLPGPAGMGLAFAALAVVLLAPGRRGAPGATSDPVCWPREPGGYRSPASWAGSPAG